MKRITAVLVLGLPVLLCGCATAGYRRASLTRSVLTDARTVTVRAQQQIDVAVQTLQDLSSQETNDLRPPYDRFATAITSLGVQVDRLANRSRVIQKLSDAYVAAWEKELGLYRGAATRTRSAERRGAVMERFQGLNQQFQTADQSLRPLLVDLKDMHRYLSIDLTLAGVTSALDLAVSIAKQATVAAQHLESLHAELGRVGKELSPVRLETEAPKEPK